jgi:hypothetical protein
MVMQTRGARKRVVQYESDGEEVTFSKHLLSIDISVRAEQ